MTSFAASLLSNVSLWEVATVVGLLYAIHKVVEYEIQSPLSKIPGPKPSILAGIALNLEQLFFTERENILAKYKRYGPIMRAGPNTVWVSSAASIRKVLGSHNYAKSPDYGVFEFDGESLFTTRNVDYHRVQKRLMLPSYTPNSLRELEPLIYESGLSQLVKRISEHAIAGENIDIMLLFKYMTFDVIGRVAFGKSFELTQSREKQHPIIDWMETAGSLGIKKLLLGAAYHPIFFRNEFATKVVEQRRKEGANGRNDSLQQLIEAVDEETGARMTDANIISQSMMLMGAGTDTTAATLTWTIHLLVEHPEITRKLVEEIKSVYPDKHMKMEYDAIQSLPIWMLFYTNQCAFDQLLHMVCLVLLLKKVLLSMAIYTRRNNHNMTISALQLTESVFPEPNAFNPDRWIDCTPEQLAVMKQHWVAFSVGPRACIGAAAPGNDMTPVFEFILRPKGGKFIVQPQLV
ncbi:cytochrome P450 [Syncephalis fuscata]|nr:cytochrome P450 [Syncephalis fuscata]